MVLEKPAIWREPKRPYEAEAVPWNCPVRPKSFPVRVFASVPDCVYPPLVVMPEIPVKTPVSEISQSLVLSAPVSPPSPKMKRPSVWKLPEIEAAESAKKEPSISRSPDISRSDGVDKSLLCVVVAVPKRLELALEKPAIW